MFNKITSIQIDTLEQLLTVNKKLLTYRELTTQLKPFYSMKQLKNILSISEGTHNRYINGRDVSPSILIHLTILLHLSQFKNN